MAEAWDFRGCCTGDVGGGDVMMDLSTNVQSQHSIVIFQRGLQPAQALQSICPESPLWHVGRSLPGNLHRTVLPAFRVIQECSAWWQGQQKEVGWGGNITVNVYAKKKKITALALFL